MGAARTPSTRNSKSPRPALRGSAALAATVCLAALGTACSGSSQQTYRAHGVSFDYPAGWKHRDLGGSFAATTGTLWTTFFYIGPSDIISVAATSVKHPITAAKIRANLPSITAEFRREFRQNGGVLQAGADRITMGGLPGFEVGGTSHSTNGTPTVLRQIYAFDGTTEYETACQNTQAKAAESKRACDQVVRTFKVIHRAT